MTAIEDTVRYRDLTRKIRVCYRVEDAIWAKLQTLGITDRSGAAAVEGALASVQQACPDWCELAAWNRIARSFVVFATAHGSLQQFWMLRRKKDDS